MKIAIVARIGHVATRISQAFPTNHQVNYVAVSPVNPNFLYCTTADNKLWVTDTGSSGSDTPVWTELSRPNNLADLPAISCITVDNLGNVYILLKHAIQIPNAGAGTLSPLIKIETDAASSEIRWIVQACSHLPAPGFNYGKLVADPDPSRPNTLYAIYGARVFRLTLVNMSDSHADYSWDWYDLSDGLPGQPIYDLWIGNISPNPTIPKVILRAPVTTRGMWERDVSDTGNTNAVILYLRDNLLDQGWLNVSPEGDRNPYNPQTERVWHYQCEDIKIDGGTVFMPPTGPNSHYFQTESVSIKHDIFDQLRDNSQKVPAFESIVPRVHMQVHNRSSTPAQNVHVWAIFCRASAGVPALNARTRPDRITPLPIEENDFNFWDLFDERSGRIDFDRLPADSRWKQVGDAVALSGI